MIFYENVYERINEDYLNGEISYEMAEAANDLAYDTYITVEEAENASSANPDPGKVKSLLSKLQNKLNSIIGQGTRINGALGKLKDGIDNVKSNISTLAANSKNCADAKISGAKTSIGDFVSDKKTKFETLPTAGKAAIGVGLAAGAVGVGVFTYKQYKKHEDEIKAAIKKLQQNIVAIAKDAAKMIKEYLSVVDWKTVILTSTLSAAAAGGVAVSGRNEIYNNEVQHANKRLEKYYTDYYNTDENDVKAHKKIKKNINKYSDEIVKLGKHPKSSKAKIIGAGVIGGAAAGAAASIGAQMLLKKQVKQIEEETETKPMIRQIIANIEAFAKQLFVKLDKSVTAMFDKFKKSK